MSTTTDALALTSRAQWIEAWSNNRVQLMTDVYREHVTVVRRRASGVCGAEAAADVAQEVFLRLWRNPGGFDPAKGSLRTYLVVLARGVAMDFVRSDARRRKRDERALPLLSSPGASGDVVIFEPILQRDTAARVRVALTQLDIRQRDAIENSFFDEMRPIDIARQRGIPEGTVKSRVRLGLAMLRPALADLDDGHKKKSLMMRADRSSESLSIRQLALHTMTAAAAVLALAGLATSCRSASANGTANGDRITIATTVAPITSIVANIVGDRADVTGIVPEGTNSHTFEPRPSVAELLSRADVVYINGLSLEEPTKRLAEQNLREGAEVIELGTSTIPESDYIYDFSFPAEGGKPNPHLWTDPTLARRYAEIVKDDMSVRDPSNADYYAGNYAKFSSLIDEFDTAMRTAFATVPKRELLTYHDAYAYFANTYGWTVIGAMQVSDFEDPTPSEVADLIDQVRSSGVTAIFGSEVFPSPVLAQIGSEARVRYVDELRDDDLPGTPGQAEHSWLGLMQLNFITMTEALGGDASALRAIDVRNVAPDEATYPR